MDLRPEVKTIRAWNKKAKYGNVPAIVLLGNWLDAIGWKIGKKYEIVAIDKEIRLKRVD